MTDLKSKLLAYASTREGSEKGANEMLELLWPLVEAHKKIADEDDTNSSFESSSKECDYYVSVSHRALTDLKNKLAILLLVGKP